jgi:hypothetical protein
MTALVREVMPRLDEIKRHAESINPAPISPCADRWLLASLLQKAIRRDQPHMALGAALSLLEIDSARVWRRLATVALEDIGVGDLDVTLLLLAASTAAVVRRALGGNRECLAAIMPLACKAVKDRTADHLGSLVRYGRSFMDGGSPDPQPPLSGRWLDYVRTGASLAHTWKEGLSPVDGVLECFQALEAPAALLEGCSLYARRVRDELFIHALTAWRIWKDEAPESVALARPSLEGHDLGGMVDYALDPLHTRLGRRAVEVWLKSYLQPPPFGLRPVAAALWNQESALCGQTLFWGLGGEIQAAAYQADLCAHGLAPERHPELDAWIRRERPLLLSAREMVWRSHVRAHRLEEAA